ncbi:MULTISPECIES: HetZ-related protein [Spirulina sp. CCY15215]|uniref:HetZ-related protein n=1 Tax=Spirulina sp. CCY15215 TaxID=2767591 RepID=UPI00194E1D41|nr:HetZ-related protein [Spirulina major]
MNANTCNLINPSSVETATHPEQNSSSPFFLEEVILNELKTHIGRMPRSAQALANRISTEVQRVCDKSTRIQKSGQIRSHQLYLAHHRLNKCLDYYKAGSSRGRVDLHSTLSTIVYRHIAPAKAQLGFSGRYNLIEDFLQDFYAESLKAFRRENEVIENYQPRTQLELAEYMSFTEQYAKRRISLPNGYSQQLIILRAQTFARRQPKETAVDIEQATEFSKGEDAEKMQRSAVVQQVRSQMVSNNPDPLERIKRDRVIASLLEYLKNQGREDCADYLTLKMQDLPASEIDEIMGLSSRERDYLQQRFKYHVEKFARISHWELVHQWLGADLEQRLGMTETQWDEFIGKLSPQQLQILELRREEKSDEDILQILNLTPKKLQKRWTELLEIAAQVRNDDK